MSREQEPLSFHILGDGPPLLLIHGGAEDASIYTPLAEVLADDGWRVIRYDRRGTGGSTRADWPGGGADQHADDAAALLRSLGAASATVLGISSGGIVALALAARHPDALREVIVWEPPLLGLLPDADAIRRSLHGPYEQHLVQRPDDWEGAFDVLLHTISQGRADLTAPSVRRMRRNAEAIIRDEGPYLTAYTIDPDNLPAFVVTAVSTAPNPLHEAIAQRLGAVTGRPPVTIPGTDGHDAYLRQPAAFAGFLKDRRPGDAKEETRTRP